MDICTTCRNPVVPGAKFCGLCGQRVSPESPAAAPERTADTPAAPRVVAPAPPPPVRRHVQVPSGVLVAGAAVLVLVLGLVAGMALMSLGDDPTPSVAAGTPAKADADLDSADPTTGPSPTPEVTCWDGSSRPTQRECPAVRGAEGMRWVFPSLDRRFDGCEPATLYDGKVRAYGCDLSKSFGASARVTYSEWSTYEAGDRHYREKYGAPDRTGTQFTNWRPSFIETNFQTSRIFRAGLPFSVTVVADDRTTASRVMGSLQFRPDSDVAPYLR